MAAFLNLDQSPAVDNGYYDRFISPFPFHHQNLMTPLLIGDQTVPRFGYFYADTEYNIYSHYWVPLYPQGFYHHNVINHPGFFGGRENNYHHQFMPCDESWIPINGQEVNHPGYFIGAESNNYHQFMPCDDSWLVDAQEEEDLTEEELRVMNSLDQDLVVYDSIYDDDHSLSEDAVTRNLKTRDHVNAVQDSVDEKICVVCQDCLFQENEKIATLDCGHEYHAGCIRDWLMHKNCCPLCNATGIQLCTKYPLLTFWSIILNLPIA